MPLGAKYIIFKTEDFNSHLRHYLGDVDWTKFSISGVVLRHQDLFTPMALYEYAGQIRSACELIEKLFPDMSTEQKDKVNWLADLADNFCDEAMSAENMQRKVPD